ncbi:MAG TPA: ABC transporter ATP-binding protein [bacterium]|nr:ABC transporter ATP-binding protein [bacterium]
MKTDTDTAMNILEIHDVYKIYKDGLIESVALRGAELSMAAGEFVAVTGRSGAGKSTLLSIIGGLSLPNAGRIRLGGHELTALDESERAAVRRQKLGIVYQADNLIPFLSALENVQLPMNLAGLTRTATRARALLADVGLANRGSHRPSQLSGGERQRVAIAVALANEPELMLADELTGELDSATAESVMDMLGQLNKERHMSLLIVTHNPAVAQRASRHVRIADGVLSEEETSHAL